MNGHAEVVNLLVSAKVPLETGDRWNCTALHWASQQGHKDIVKILFDAGGDINACSKANKTPADKARLSGHKELAEYINSTLGGKFNHPPPKEDSKVVTQ